MLIEDENYEPPWMTSKVRNEIEIWKKQNRKQRNEIDKDFKEKYFKEYREQRN